MSRIAGVRRVAALAIILPGLGLAAEALAQTRAKPAAPAVRRPAAPAAPPVKARDWGVSDALLRTAFDEEIASAALKDATIPELQAAAQRGDPRAQTILGMIYEHGSGGQARDVDRAATLYEQAAAKVPRAKNNYAFMLQNGLGVVKDLSRALALYKESFAEGNANAAVDIGRMYAGGVGVAKDPAQAHLWFLRAAEGGVPAAMRLVGNDYRSGTGVAKDTATARTWYERAIVAGDRLSFAPMGDFYQFGDGVTVDLVKAAEFYRTGDEKGDLISTSRLGYFYVQGQGGLPKDPAKGVAMIQRAADRGLALAKETLGILYQQGLGVPRNLDTAERYYRESIAAGRTNTQALLDRLQQSRANAQQAQAQAAAAERERQARLRREAEEEAEAEAEEEAETAAANRAALSAVMGMIAKNGGAGAAAGVGGAGAARPSTRGPVSAPIQGCAQLSERGVLKNICGEQLSFFGHNGPDTNVQPWLFVNAGETRIVGNYYRYIVACKPRFEIERYHPQCAPE